MDLNGPKIKRLPVFALGFVFYTEIYTFRLIDYRIHIWFRPVFYTDGYVIITRNYTGVEWGSC